MENEEQNNLETFGAKYLTEEQIAEIKDEIEKDDFLEHLEAFVSKVRGYLIQNNTMDVRMRKIFALLASLSRINKDETLMKNQFIAPAFVYHPFVILGLLTEVGVYDPSNIRVETGNNPLNPFKIRDAHKNEA